MQYHADAAENRVASVMSSEEWGLLQERAKKRCRILLVFLDGCVHGYQKLLGGGF